MTTILLWACIAGTLCLAAYSLGLYLSSAVFLGWRPDPRPFPEFPTDAVAVLVPSRNEGAGAVRVLRSLLDQDHRGLVEAHLLLKDRTDSSLPFLASAFPGVRFEGGGSSVDLWREDRRRVVVHFVGEDGKSEKLNWMRERLSTPYAAILDCDHQAHPDWLRTSLCLLRETGARFVQGRRHPLFVGGFFSLWDALHQHIGCEVFNIAFSALGLTVFFTGTTVVAETALLRANAFRRGITEDVDYSYRLLMQGVKIIHNPYSGSDEEVSPDLYSFLARRRRWANGHTDAFFRHVGKLPSAPLSLQDRVQFLFHGVHYLIVVLVFLLHLVIGLFFVTHLSPGATASAVAASLVVATAIARTQRSSGWRTWASEVAVVFGWFFPAVLIAMNLALGFLLNDLSRAALPIPGAIQVIGLAGLCAPLVVLLCGLAGFGQLGVNTLVAVVATYPVAFYLDISGVLIGTLDFLLGRQRWDAVARTPRATATAGPHPGVSPTMGIRDSLRPAVVLGVTRESLHQVRPRLSRPASWTPWTLLLILALGGVFWVRHTRIPIADAPCEILEHDGHPWIVAPEKLSGYCDASPGQRPRWTRRASGFEATRVDDPETADPGYWERLDTTFFCNQAVFAPENVVPLAGGGVGLRLREEARGEKAYTAGSIATRQTRYLYGRFETVMKPAKASGVISAFFLYRFDPWQEIDTEFVGRDTSRILLNVFYNPGEEGDLYNYGYRGTPVLVDLGFDASEDFHRYAVEWDVDEIRWFVDGVLIHKRSAGRPTPIPHLPMRFHINVWPTCSEELAGPLDPSALPVVTELKSVSIYRRAPSAMSRLLSVLESPFSRSGRGRYWQDDAEWLQPRTP